MSPNFAVSAMSPRRVRGERCSASGGKCSNAVANVDILPSMTRRQPPLCSITAAISSGSLQTMACFKASAELPVFKRRRDASLCSFLFSASLFSRSRFRKNPANR